MFIFDKERTEEFIVTKVNEYCIQEINDRNAVEEYSKAQHIRPYLINLLSGLLIRPDFPQLLGSLIKVNTIMYKGVISLSMKLLGNQIHDGFIEPLVVFGTEEHEVDSLFAHIRKPKGTKLKWTKTSKEDHLEIFDKLKKRVGDNCKFLLIHQCAVTSFWIDFDYNAINEKIKAFRCPIFITYVWGEFGTYLPYNKSEQNVAHGATVKALVFK